MNRRGLWILLALFCVPACKDWTRVTPPPVRLSFLESSPAAAGSEGPSPVPTGPRVRLIRALSPGALATLHLPDMRGAAKRFEGTSLYKLFTSSEMKELLGPTAFRFNPLSVTGAAPGGMNAARLQRALSGELILGLEDIELRADQPFPNIRALLGVTVNGAEQDVRQLIEFLKLATAQDPEVKIEQGSIEGTAFTRFRTSKGPIPMEIEVALYGNALLIGFGSEVVTDAIVRLHKEESETLSDDASFGRCMQQISHPDDVARVHVDIAGLVSRFGARIPDEARPFLDVLGVEHMQSFAGALRIQGKNLVTTSFLDSPGGNDLLTGLLRRHPVNRKFLQQVPASATSFSLFSLDGTALLAQLRAKLPADAKAEMESALEQLQKDGVELEREILPVFGPRAALVTVPAGRRGAKGIDAFWNQLLGTAFLIEIRDREKALTQLAHLPASKEEMLRFEERIGATHVIGYRFPGPRLPHDFGLFLAPMGDYLVVAASREAMRQMLQRPSADAIQHFVSEVKLVPDNATALSYDDMSHGNGMLLQAAWTGLMEAQRKNSNATEEAEETDLDWSKLPLGGLSPAISYTIADERGILSCTTSATGGLTEAGGLTGAFVAASIALPNLAQARIEANEEAAIIALKAIRGAQIEHRNGLIRDSDGDGEGEHAFLSELLADGNGRRGGLAAAPAILHGFERTPMGYRKSGYYFRVYLPAEDGSPIGDHESAKRLNEVDGDLAESIVVVVAWPRGEGTTGRRSFFLDSRGVLRFCAGGYGGEQAPPPDLFSTQRGNLAAATIRRRARPHDGQLWMELK